MTVAEYTEVIPFMIEIITESFSQLLLAKHQMFNTLKGSPHVLIFVVVVKLGKCLINLLHWVVAGE